MSNSPNQDQILEQYTTIFKNSLDAILLTKTDGSIFYANPAAEELFGYEQHEICKLGRIGLVACENENLEIMLEQWESSGKTKGELNVIKKDGTIFPAEVTTSIFMDVDGVKTTFMLIRDISSRKHEAGIKQKLLEHEQQLTEELQTSNEELQSMTMELQKTNQELIDQQNYLIRINQALIERKELSEALNRVNANINSKLDYDTIMQSILEEGTKAIQAESSVINLLENDNWKVEYVYNFPNNIKGQIKSPEESPTSVYVADKGEAIAFNDAVNDPRVNINGMKSHGVASLLAAPIILKNNIMGVIVFYHHKKTVNFSDAKIDFANKLASSLSQAIENAQLFETVKKSEKKYHSLYSSMNEGVAIHDVIYNSKHEAVDYVVTDINNSYQKILGLNKDDVIGKTATEIYGTEKPPYLEIYSRVAKTGRFESFKTYFEPMQKHFSISIISPEKDKFATVFEDITERIESEKKLHESEEKYRSIINNLQDGYIRADREGKIIMVSPSAARMYRYNSTDEMEGTEAISLYRNVEDRDFLFKKLNQYGKVNDLESVALRRDGTSFSVSLNSQYHYDEHGKIMGTEAFVRDITERKLIEAHLKKSENSLAEAQRIAHIGSWEWNLETEKIVWSDELYSIYDVNKDTFTPSMNSFAKYLHPEDQEYVDEKLSQLLSGSETIIFNFRIILDDGSIRVLNTRAEITDWDDKRNPRVIMGINQDITEVKKAEEELLMRKKVLDAINQVFQESFSSEEEKDVVKKCLEVSQELSGSEFGFLGEINKNGRLDDRMLSPPAWDKCQTPNALELLKDMEIVSYWGRTIKEGKSQLVNDPDSDPDRRGLPEGHPPIHSFLGVPLKQGEKMFGIIALANKSGGYTEIDRANVETLSVAIVEVLMRKRAEVKIKENMKRLEQSNKELEQFAYITSHDLREPLRMISSFLQLLERRYKDQLDQDANEFIEFAVNGAKRLDNMTNDLLLYSRISSKKKITAPVNFEKVLEEALQNLKIPIEENNATITHDPLPTIMGDAKLKVQLFQNIIGNAIKYRSNKTPEIHISAKKENKNYIFRIKDNGIGMSPQHLKKIFTIFQRLHTHEDYEGTGIGLAIAQKIVQLQGGKIWAKSELGQGSTFYFTIPIKPDMLTLNEELSKKMYSKL